MKLEKDESFKNFVENDQNRVSINDYLEELRGSINDIPSILIRRLIGLKGKFLPISQSKPNDFSSQIQKSIGIRSIDQPQFEEKIQRKLYEYINDQLIHELTKELEEHYSHIKFVGQENSEESGVVYNSIFDALEDWFQESLDLVSDTLENKIFDKISSFIELEPSFKRILDEKFFENEFVPIYRDMEFVDNPELPEIVRIQKLKDVFLSELEKKVIPSLLNKFSFEQVVKSFLKRPVEKVTKSAKSFKHEQLLEREVKESKAELINIQSRWLKIIIRDRVLGIFIIVAFVAYLYYAKSSKIPDELLKRIEILEKENKAITSRVEKFEQQVQKMTSEKERLNTELNKVYQELTKVN